MDYKEKVIALLNSQELSNEQKEKLESIFPELKESDDERIRKEIIDYIKTGTYKKDWITWLEKQDEQGNNEDEAILHRFSFYSYKDEPNILYLAGLYVNDEYRNKGIGTKILKIADEVAVSMKCSSILLKTEIGSNAERLYKNNGYSVFRMEENQVWLEKQGEQKPDDKVEPKFREGEWITNGDYTWKIIEVKPLDYILQSQNGNIVDDTISHVDGQFHSFTIEDAKDGNVLANDHHILILRELGYSWEANGNPDSLYAYCGIKPNGNFELEQKGYCFCGTLHTHPATKEQCDTLMKAMADAGYTFDFEKKELKKIEQKHAEWSEEDEMHRHWILEMLKDGEIKTPEFADHFKAAFNWLKSLRPQNKWKPSDEQMKALETTLYTNMSRNDERYSVLSEFVEELKKLKEE